MQATHEVYVEISSESLDFWLKKNTSILFESLTWFENNKLDFGQLPLFEKILKLYTRDYGSRGKAEFWKCAYNGYKRNKCNKNQGYLSFSLQLIFTFLCTSSRNYCKKGFMMKLAYDIILTLIRLLSLIF